MYSKFSSNSEAKASENLEEMVRVYYMRSDVFMYTTTTH